MHFVCVDLGLIPRQYYRDYRRDRLLLKLVVAACFLCDTLRAVGDYSYIYMVRSDRFSSAYLF